MVTVYKLSDFDLGASLQSGHEVYLDAVYKPNGIQDKPYKVIVKKNKHHNPVFSRLEIAFSQITRLFFPADTTSRQRLVINDHHKVIGLVVEHLCYVIEKKEGLKNSYYRLNKLDHACQLYAFQATHAEEIPFYFFDQLPQGFFADLIQSEQRGILSLDYSSLASIFSTSYALEEDDLHKGNFGFYVIQKEGKPRVVFFKIDHDLMFADSIMSFYSTRVSHWGQSGDAFAITACDLIDFPRLSCSMNAYWPTRKSFFPNPFQNKDYHSDNEVRAFAALAKNPEFIKAKWLALYKHIVFPNEAIESVLRGCLDEQIAGDRALIAKISHSTAARHARLRAVLFSIQEFRDFVRELPQSTKDNMLQELNTLAPDSTAQAAKNMHDYHQYCDSPTGFSKGDTPLHIAIKLGDYRSEESAESFREFLNVKNGAGLTPLDVACQMASMQRQVPDDIRQDARFTIRHLLTLDVKQTPAFRRFHQVEQVESYAFKTPYMQLAREAKTYRQLKNVLQEVGEDHRFSLKLKKNLAIECVNHFIQSNLKHPHLRGILIQFKRDLDGTSSAAQAASLLYIRQLRSTSWLVRFFRGPYGRTTTQDAIHHLIAQELAKPIPKSAHSFSFFGPGLSAESDNELADTLTCAA